MPLPCLISPEPHSEKHWLSDQNPEQQINRKHIPGIYSPPVAVLGTITKNMARWGSGSTPAPIPLGQAPFHFINTDKRIFRTVRTALWPQPTSWSCYSSKRDRGTWLYENICSACVFFLRNMETRTIQIFYAGSVKNNRPNHHKAKLI